LWFPDGVIATVLLCCPGTVSATAAAIAAVSACLPLLFMQVLRVSGTLKQQAAAGRLIPLVARPHWLLCTLLLCNAACMEALPMFLDRLLNPVAAILMSVTAILLFGEIIPQAVCSRCVVEGWRGGCFSLGG
jgi:metal transporter CNNM